MKVDLNDLLIKQVKKEIKEEIKQEVFEYFSNDLEREFNKYMKEYFEKNISGHVNKKISNILDIALKEKFIPTSPWNEKSEETTLEEHIKTLFKKACNYDKKQWRSDENAFTQTMSKILGKMQVEVKDEIWKIQKSEIINYAVKYALQEIKETWGVK